MSNENSNEINDNKELSEEQKIEQEKQNRKIERDSDLPYVDLRDGAKGIGVWCQTEKDKLSEAALELIGEANRVKQKLNKDSQQITAVIIGPAVSQHTQTLIEYGADKVVVVENSELHDYMTLPYTKAICQVIKEIKQIKVVNNLQYTHLTQQPHFQMFL